MKSIFKIICMLFLSVSFLFGQESFSLKYKYENGKDYLYRTNLGMKSTQTFNGNSSGTTSDLYSITRYHISGIDNDKFTIVASLDSLYSKTETEIGGSTIDRGERTKGKKTGYLIDKYGTLIKKEDIDSLKGRNADSYLSTRMIFQLPSKEVKQGDTWTAEMPDVILSPGGKFKSTTTTNYKLEGKEIINGTECLKISFDANLVYNGSTEAKANMNGEESTVTISVDGKAKNKGVFYFDYNKGIIISCESVLKTDEATFLDQNEIDITTEYKVSMSFIN